jgi:hypothetical protein
MLTYAWRRVTADRSLWWPALGCAFMAALPGALAGTLLATPLVAFLVTGNPLLAYQLLPEWLRVGQGVGIVAGGLVIGSAALCLWSRLYVVGIAASDETRVASDETTPGHGSARTKRWPAVALVYLQSGIILACFLVPPLVVAFISSDGGSAGLALVLLAIALIVRTIIKVATTLAIRSVVLDEASSRVAWRHALSALRERRGEAAAVWAALLALGAAVWFGGRLISPILQDTAFDYPAASGYSFAREAAQILLSVPLEAFLLAFSFGAWTAFHRGIDERPDRVRNRSSETSRSWVPRVAAACLVLTVISNGIPTAVDGAWRNQLAGKVAAVGADEIEIEDVLRTPSGSGDPARTKYEVQATLEDDNLEWTTSISYLNSTGEHLRTIGVHLYPAAYERAVPDIPLARDLLAGDLTGTFGSAVESGTFTINDVQVNGDPVTIDVEGTAMTLELERPLAPRRRALLTIDLSAELPVFPERFGTWEGMTLLGNWVPAIAVRSDGGWRLDEFGTVGDPFFSEVADYKVSIELDSRQRIAGSGVLTKLEQTSQDTRTWHFEAPASRDVAFAVASFMQGLQKESGGITVRSWYPANTRLVGSKNLDTAARAVEHFRTRFGDLPFDEIDVIATEGVLGGMEYPGVIFVSGSSHGLEGLPLLPDLLRYAGFDDAQSSYVLGHELAHQWWYASVGNDQVREPWLDEALAEVSAITWLRALDGEDRAWRMTNLLAELPDTTGQFVAGIGAFDSNTEYTDAVYLGGARALLDLRQRIGADAFDQILRNYHEANKLGIASAADFLNAVSEVAGTAASASLGLPNN